MVDKTESGFAPINGAEIFYTQTNPHHSETMLMIHAGICDHRMWEKQVIHFSKRFHVMTLDMRGFGKSSIPDAPFSDHDDIMALLKYVEVDSAWFLACSMGGKVAINIALLQPKLVKGLLLSGPAYGGYRYESDEPHPLDDAFDTAEANNDMEAMSELEVQLWVDGEGRSSDKVDPTVRKLVYEMNLIPLMVDNDIWDKEQSLEPPASERLADITQPTLIIIGDLDVAPSIERADNLAEAIPNAKKVVMTGTAHVPNMEFPDQFNTIVDDFLRNL